VPIEVVFEIVTDVGAPLFVNVAVVSGTAGLELQLLPWVHSLGTGAPPPSQVPSTACAGLGSDMASAPRQTPPSNAARVIAGRMVAASRIDLPNTNASGAHR